MRTLLMLLITMACVALCQLALRGVLFGLPMLIFWIAVGVLCIGAGSTRLHYHTYLKAVSHNDVVAHAAMAEELALIHGLPLECDEREYLRELQNALLWINYRFYLAPLFWFVVGGRFF